MTEAYTIAILETLATRGSVGMQLLIRRWGLAALMALMLTGGACAQDGGPADPDDQRRRAVEANERGVALVGEGRLEPALIAFKRARSLAPDDETIGKNLARCHAYLGAKAMKERRFEDAAGDYARAEEADGKEASYPTERGRAQIENKELDAAALTLRDAVRRFPKVARGWSLLGLALYQNNQNKEAIAAWDKALALDPKDPIARAYRAKAASEDKVEGELEEDFGAPHFRVKLDGNGGRDLARTAGALLEDAYEEVGRAFNVYPKGTTPVVIYPAKTFRKVTGAHAWVQALYDGKIRIPGGLLSRPTAELSRVFRHEYCHALVARVAGSRCPVWLHEGLAQTVDGSSPQTAAAILAKQGIPKAAALKQRFGAVRNEGVVRSLYAASFLFVRWLSDRFGGLLSFEGVLKDLGAGKSIDAAFRGRFGADVATLYGEWSRP